MTQYFFETKYLHVFHQNIAGLITKSDILQINLDELTDRNLEIDVICITEHFMIEGDEQSLRIYNYNLAACFSRDKSRRGGACILVKKEHRWRGLPELSKMSLVNVFECCAIELTDYNIAIICFYRVPKRNNLPIFLSKLEKVLSYISKKKYSNILIAGDFNIDVLKNNNITLDLECLLLNFNCKLALRQPTRLSSKTCIDNFAHNFNKKCKAEVLEFGLSDHTAQVISFAAKHVPRIKFWRKYVRDFCQENIEKFKVCLESYSFPEIYNTTDASSAYSNFLNVFKLFYDMCFPLKQIKIFINKKAKWITRGLKICSKRKRHLLWISRSKPSNVNKNKYRSYSKLFKRIISLTKKAQNNYKIKTSDNKSKTVWQIINESRFEKPKEQITKIKLDDDYISHPLELANAFNDYFVDKIQPISKSDRNITAHIDRQPQSMFMPPCLPQDVKVIIAKLKNTNSVGHDGISTKVIKSVSDQICHHLCHIINLTIETGIFPEDLKLSIIKPLFKKNNKELMEYYRPIALNSIFSKVMEKYYYKELYAYLEKFNILCNEQNGFRRNKSINIAIFEFLKIVMSHVDKTLPVCTIFCDMTQAFDYVDHGILIKKLDAYGIRGNVLDLFRSYLSDRQQVTEIMRFNNKTRTEELFRSDTRNVKYGVPQGSVLGPLLFLIYINDLPNATDQPMTLFADDSTVSVKFSDISTYELDINKTLTLIIDWLKNNNLKINIDKTNIMHFSQRAQFAHDIKVKYSGNIINKVETARFLGLQIDAKLNWKNHIAEISKRISSLSYALYRLSFSTNIDTLLTAYHGMVESVLRYGIIFWGNSTDKHIIFKMQKRCLRAMSGLQTTDSCKPYFTKYKILTLPSLYILEMALFVKTYPHLFPKKSAFVVRNRRHGDRLCIHAAKTTLLQNSVICMAPKIYNKIPEKYKSLNKNLFRANLKSFLVEKCYYTIQDFLNDKSV